MIQTEYSRTAGVALTVFVLFYALIQPVTADVVGGSDIWTGAYESQFENWLGEGQLRLTNIYDKASGDTAADFHAAADEQGRTVTVMELINTSGSLIVGGYNPQSWHSRGSYNFTHNAVDQDGFLFNLTYGDLYEQNERWQTYNHIDDGPTWGGGHDLTLFSDLNGGYANIGHTYGDRGRFGDDSYREQFAGPFNS